MDNPAPGTQSGAGEEGARALLNGDPSRVTAVDLPELAVDLDTPADVESFRTSSRSTNQPPA